MAKKKRYLLRDSDRSGYTYREVELVNDKGFLVGGDEFDTPPPSDKLYPGEGDVSPGDTRLFYQSYTDPTAQAVHIQYVTAAGGINLFFTDDNSNFEGMNSVSGWFYVVGSNSSVAITKNPQIVSAFHGDQISLECTGSSVILRNGSGLRLYTSVYRMDSGSQINLIFNATNGLWNETSRGSRVRDLLGAF